MLIIYRALDDRAGCTRQTISVLEQERHVPSLLLAFKIAQVFGTTVEAIFTLEEASGR